MNCGTLKGWQQHKAANTRCCSYCAPYDPRLANPKKEVVVRKPRAKAAPKPRTRTVKPRSVAKPRIRRERPPIICGTPQGESLHRRNHETPCEPCRLAYNEQVRERRAAKPKAPRPRGKCGTNAGASIHYREHTELCQPCKDARNKFNRDNNAKKKARRA